MLGAEVVHDEVPVGQAQDAFTPAGSLADPHVDAALTAAVDALARAAAGRAVVRAAA
jgi:hypothetical protein